VWGIGFHWYEPWSGGDQMFDNVTLVRDTFPRQNLIFTEGCIGPFKAADLENWRLGEAYGRSMINRSTTICGLTGAPPKSSASLTPFRRWSSEPLVHVRLRTCD
jgi:hypothetical protein